MKYDLDLKAGLDLWRSELYGDWYRDPWAWPELAWLEKSLSKVEIDSYLESKNRTVQLRTLPFFHLVDIPKSRLGIRPAVVQDPLSRWLYLSAVASSAATLHQSLAKFVYGWRVRDAGKPERNGPEWGKYIEWIRIGGKLESALQTDVTSCFASIEINRLAEELRQRLGNKAPAHLMIQVGQAHDALSNRSGLPQRSFGSAIVANYFLTPIDDCLTEAQRAGKVKIVTRWMDDITAFGIDSALYELFLDIQQVMRSVGLEANSAKSVLVAGAQAVDAVDLEHGEPLKIRSVKFVGSAGFEVDYDQKDVDRVLNLEREVLDKGGAEGKHAIKKILLTLRNAELFDRHDEWLSVAHQMPHAADSLGRFFRAAALCGEDPEAKWRELQEWLVDFYGQPWSRVPWVRAQLALSVPVEQVGKSILNVMEGWLADSDDVQLVAVAAQRLAARAPETCRSIISGRADRVTDPLLQRVLGLAVLATGSNRNLAQKLVRRDQTNQILAQALEDNGWAAPPISSDFDEGPDA
ncbi:reverse transcriptase (RNA-dependent DNA polymerase) [Lentzea atacamensis]|uniref:Reverse transcriptase (RNA-dependent DNA polymerase) n=1 Tax=Lentzea atacamensis TaxID=531938 RepID=A0A316I4J0_9PSEU|nr:hypothetical protein [Lentzea atacamensis]PWK82248.1 reverse transcriptase (RNA-dependent DNA polymerase) [Lentzea atacamensis]